VDLASAEDLLARLVVHDTTSSRSNWALIREICEYLHGHGVEPLVVSSDDGSKAGLIASVGPNVTNGIVLSGHTDVVPVAGQVWCSDPFRMQERGGRLYGRGTADMKGFLAAALAMVPLFREAPLSRPVHLAFSWDEEVGCLGAPKLIAALLAHRPRPALVIVGEPTELQVADRHRGISTYVTTLTGSGGHSSAPARGVNAIGLAARFIVELDRRAGAMASGHLPPQGAESDSAVPEHTTLNVGRIEGGSAVNMIAEWCHVTWECRSGADGTAVLEDLERFVADELLADVKRFRPRVAVETRQLVSVPALLPQTDSPAVALLRRLTGQTVCVAAPFSSEAGLFQQAGIPAVVCGPGSVRQAHQPDEFLQRTALDACLTMLRRLAG
jgi:acetylornithine deacetylase